MPDDVAKLSNVVKNDVVKKTDFSADDYVKKTKFTADTNALDDKIDKVEKKIPNVGDLATRSSVTTLIKNLDDRIDNLEIKEYAKKTSLSDYVLTNDFNTINAALEGKITANDGKVTSLESDLSAYAKKTDVANDITTIKNYYVTNASLTSQLNDLKSHHVATEGKTIDDKTKKNASDILRFENRLKEKEDIVDENQREASFNRGFFFYINQSYLVYDCKMGSFNFSSGKISVWKSTGIFNYHDNSNMNAVGRALNDFPALKNDGRMSVNLTGNHFQQNRVIVPNNNNAINIYRVYNLEPIASSRSDTFTIQNALFGAMQIIKNSYTSKYNYKGYGICFDESGSFGHTRREGNFDHTTNARNVLIFGVDMSSSIHATNRANNIYVMGKDFIQGINDTTIYAEKNFYRNFTDRCKKFVLSLHYNGAESYLRVNGRQELKFKCKTDQLVKEKLCLGNLSDKWTLNESEKTGLYGNIYYFVVDYEQIVGVKPIYDLHRYLMIKHNIK